MKNLKEEIYTRPSKRANEGQFYTYVYWHVHYRVYKQISGQFNMVRSRVDELAKNNEKS